MRMWYELRVARVRPNAVSVNTVKVRIVICSSNLYCPCHSFFLYALFGSTAHCLRGFINSYTPWMEDPCNTRVLHGFTVPKKFHDRWEYILQYRVLAKILVPSTSIEELESKFLVIHI
jgi:hypothetical protein